MEYAVVEAKVVIQVVIEKAVVEADKTFVTL